MLLKLSDQLIVNTETIKHARRRDNGEWEIAFLDGPILIVGELDAVNSLLGASYDCVQLKNSHRGNPTLAELTERLMEL